MYPMPYGASNSLTRIGDGWHVVDMVVMGSVVGRLQTCRQVERAWLMSGTDKVIVDILRRLVRLEKIAAGPKAYVKRRENKPGMRRSACCLDPMYQRELGRPCRICKKPLRVRGMKAGMWPKEPANGEESGGVE